MAIKKKEVPKKKTSVTKESKLKNKGGRPRKFESPEVLETECKKYFKWADKNPWYHNEVIKGGKEAGKILPVPTQRPYTVIAMCHHIGIITETWGEYNKLSEFSALTTRIREKIDNMKYEGAVVGAFNANIIARDLGLRDKQEITGQDGKSIEVIVGMEIL